MWLSKSVDADIRDLITSITDENASALTDWYNFHNNNTHKKNKPSLIRLWLEMKHSDVIDAKRREYYEISFVISMANDHVHFTWIYWFTMGTLCVDFVIIEAINCSISRG